jgi:predicted TIM-barrel fold metal-dependent hydrolase
MRIVANHAHLMPPLVQGAWWLDGGVDLLLHHLDDCNIERTLVFPPFANQVEGSGMRANLWALGEVQRHPDRLIPAGTTFPLAGDAMDILQMLHDREIHWIKIHPAIDLHDIADPKAAPFYARAAELGFVLDYHTGPHGAPLSYAKPEKFDALAWAYPGLRLVFEHVGGRVYFPEFAAVLSNHSKSTFGGLTSIFSPDNYLWRIEKSQLEALVKGLGADRFIFGLDFPWNSAVETRQHIQVIRSLDITEEDKELILGGNLAHLLGI